MTKQKNSKIRFDYSLLMANINYYLRRRGIKKEELSKTIGFKAFSTWYTREKDPSSFTLKELEYISYVLDVEPFILLYSDFIKAERKMDSLIAM